MYFIISIQYNSTVLLSTEYKKKPYCLDIFQKKKKNTGPQGNNNIIL